MPNPEAEIHMLQRQVESLTAMNNSLQDAFNNGQVIIANLRAELGRYRKAIDTMEEIINAES